MAEGTSQPADSGLGLAPEGSGPEVWTVTVPRVIGGVPTNVRMQVVAFADAEGLLLRPGTDLDDVVAVMTKTNELLELILEAVT